MTRERGKHAPAESRWPVVLAILAVFTLLAALPDRIRLVPAWVPYLAVVVGLLPMAAVSLAPDKTRWLRVERAMTLILFAVMTAGTVTSLAHLVSFMVRRSAEIRGLELLTSSIGVWVSNVLMFALLYWQTDRGGPVARSGGATRPPDWLFPQEGRRAEHVRPGWTPGFVDYLFLAFSTATSFSATDVVPLTPRAKVTMMLEASISLVTIVVVMARAINALGS